MAPKDTEEDDIVAVDDRINDVKKKRETPLVRLDLENITYAPLTRAAKGRVLANHLSCLISRPQLLRTN